MESPCLAISCGAGAYGNGTSGVRSSVILFVASLLFVVHEFNLVIFLHEIKIFSFTVWAEVLVFRKKISVILEKIQIRPHFRYFCLNQFI